MVPVVTRMDKKNIPPAAPDFTKYMQEETIAQAPEIKDKNTSATQTVNPNIGNENKW